MNEPHPYRGFILSAGRTGTVWLAQTLGVKFDDVQFVHEPPPARTELMLGNMRNRLGIGRNFLRKRFLSTREKRVARLLPGNSYVEINPMLCPITDLLGELSMPLNVVHQVRDPRTWTTSILRFKAAGFRRHLIDYIPFATPYPCPRPPGWRKLGPVERTLWRWRYCNEQILKIKPKCDRFALVKYEDIFSDDQAIRHVAMVQILETLRVPPNIDFSSHVIENRINTSQRENSSEQLPDESVVQSICGKLLSQFGYENPKL